MNSELSLLVEKYGSPLYIFDAQNAINRIHKIQKELGCNVKLCYAIKANAFLLKALKDEDILFEVCSPGELSICQKYKVAPEKIVFSGVCKTEDDVRRAYKMGVNTITLESKAHLEYLLSVVGTEEYHSQDVIIRLTSGNQFGMSESDIYECIEKIKECSNIKIRGIHFFTGTQKKIKKISEEITFIESFCTELQEKTGVFFDSIEYGPGLGYDYFSISGESLNFENLKEFSALIKNSKYNYVIELGRFIASPCGKYCTRIMDIKTDEEANNKYIIIDGGINHINYYGQMMGMKTPKIDHIAYTRLNGADIGDYTIAGSLCTTADIVIRKLSLSSPAVGDILVFNDIGAYSVTEGIYLFLSHPLPAILLKNNDSYELLRNSMETFSFNS
ncbi:alanine racemase [uncultured Treponema sp.]|uniref:diaminopimelate decarboxylase family protein n=1 Tax=uncultured Treponema sp. TaxID=162155 RepID=UPI0025FF5DEC|nr:alanine racemase [uncultured Treponema sp.]